MFKRSTTIMVLFGVLLIGLSIFEFFNPHVPSIAMLWMAFIGIALISLGLLTKIFAKLDRY